MGEFDVLIIGGYRTFAGPFQRIWDGFVYRLDRVNQYVLYRDDFLYNERLLYDGEGDEDEIYIDWRVACNSCRTCSKRSLSRNDGTLEKLKTAQRMWKEVLFTSLYAVRILYSCEQQAKRACLYAHLTV